MSRPGLPGKLTDPIPPSSLLHDDCRRVAAQLNVAVTMQRGLAVQMPARVFA
jgi:hypothetical protein